MKDIEKKIGYEFKNKQLIATALVHSSYANENKSKKIEHNERLEFLGDSVLGMICADYLYTHYRHLPEGQLTKIRAAIVCEQSLYEIAISLKINEEIVLGKGEGAGGGNMRVSILADAVEAILAAIYLDGGIDKAREFIMRYIPDRAALAIKGKAFSDYKTTLQEIVQKSKEEVLSYRLKDASGPDHDKSFTIELLLNSNIIAEGVGRSKKEAEQMAAKAALELMGE